jgi:hypothetical protein
MPWNPGDHITLRYVGHHDGRTRDRPGVLQGWPYIVAHDTPDLLALWMPVGTRMRMVDMADRSRVVRDLVHGEHPHEEFRRGEVLRLMQPGKPYSIWLHWSPQPPHDFLGWYVNLEAPFVRTSIGVDTTDNSLDLVVLPDYSWQWKDEHLTQRWIDLGTYTREETDQFFVHGREVIADVEARRFPFDGSWLDFRPDGSWDIPTVVPGWDTLPGYDLPLTTGRRLPWTDPPRG